MNKIDKDTNSATCKNFNELYPELIQHLLSEGSLVESRNGDSIELLDFKTIVRDPEQNLVGGYGRNMNIFFLFAEAVWIWLGKKEVDFLEFFNSQMKEYSDDGENFHAPYGWRLRNFDIPSIPKIKTTNGFNRQLSNDYGLDQIGEVVRILSKNPSDRRAVLSIWNPKFDLGVDSKDLPCNDMLFLKIRKGRLFLTIANRSNDLHWGLPTNVFQFSFIGFLLSKVLGVERGTQVHNSQSLHVYLSNPLTLKILSKIKEDKQDIYEFKQITQDILLSGDPSSKLMQIDKMLETFYKLIENIIKGIDVDKNISQYNLELEGIKFKSEYLFVMFFGLLVYIKYALSDRKESDRVVAFEILKGKLQYRDAETLLMKNFFLSRLKSEDCLDL